MTTEELTLLLARIQVLDNRQVDDLTIEAWAPIVGDLGYQDAVHAVNQHFRNSTEYLRPGHVVAGAREHKKFETARLERVAKKYLGEALAGDDSSNVNYLPINLRQLGQALDDNNGAEVQKAMRELDAAFTEVMGRPLNRAQPPAIGVA
ncbi:MAG: hypothetical protein WED09_11970 [Homoserinimonas sp.]